MKMHASIAVLAIALASASAHAALGGHETSVAGEVQAQRALNHSARPSTKTASGAIYTRHDLALAGGGSISEYADVDGLVFAVTWSTATMPDLDSLLGEHKAELDAAQIQSRATGIRSPRNLSVAHGDLSLSSTGHMRAYRGQAHLTSLLPQGFDLKELSK